LSGASRTDVWKFWTGQTVSQLGSSFTFFALPLLVYQLTGSSLNLAVTTAAYFLPYLLFGLVIGAWVDRVDRKRMMVGVDLGRAAVLATIPLLSYADALSASGFTRGRRPPRPGRRNARRRLTRRCVADEALQV
jgi:MFS family permease